MTNIRFMIEETSTGANSEIVRIGKLPLNVPAKGSTHELLTFGDHVAVFLPLSDSNKNGSGVLFKVRTFAPFANQPHKWLIVDSLEVGAFPTEFMPTGNYADIIDIGLRLGTWDLDLSFDDDGDFFDTFGQTDDENVIIERITFGKQISPMIFESCGEQFAGNLAHARQNFESSGKAQTWREYLAENHAIDLYLHENCKAERCGEDRFRVGDLTVSANLNKTRRLYLASPKAVSWYIWLQETYGEKK